MINNCSRLSIVLFLLMTAACSSSSSSDSPSYEKVTLSPQGGTHALDNGLVIDVPEGAVTRETEIAIREVSASELVELFSPLGLKKDSLLAAFDGTPEGTTFLQPIEITFPAIGLQPWQKLVVREFDLQKGTYAPAETEFSYDAAKDSVTVSVAHFSGNSVGTRNWENPATVEKYKKICEDEATRCRCQSRRGIQRDKDIACSEGDCQIVETTTEVTYSACPDKLQETYVSGEVSAGCKPRLKLTAGSTSIAPNESTTITATTSLGCAQNPSKNLDTAFSADALGDVDPASTKTDDAGRATTTFMAGDREGTAKVTANQSLSYHASYTKTSGELSSEKYYGELINVELDESVSISITEEAPEPKMETWSGTVTITNDCEVGYIQFSGSITIDFEFDLDVSKTRWEIVTSAKASQQGKVTIGDYDKRLWSVVEITGTSFPSLQFEHVRVNIARRGDTFTSLSFGFFLTEKDYTGPKEECGEIFSVDEYRVSSDGVNSGEYHHTQLCKVMASFGNVDLSELQSTWEVSRDGGEWGLLYSLPGEPNCRKQTLSIIRN